MAPHFGLSSLLQETLTLISKVILLCGLAELSWPPFCEDSEQPRTIPPHPRPPGGAVDRALVSPRRDAAEEKPYRGSTVAPGRRHIERAAWYRGRARRTLPT